MAVSRVGGKYELIGTIGKGGMGEVHLARLEAPRGVRKLVALKVAIDADAASQITLFQEARLAALIVHPNVAQLFDAGVEGSLAWFTMEYVPGPSLAELLALPRGAVPPWTWVRIFADACAALHAVHEARDEHDLPLHIVHRDITPQNLLVGWNGVCKLVDFGIARSALRNAPTTTGVVKGKLGYMSPEQAGGEQVDRRSDIFAIGVLMWEALAGRRLFARATEAETLASILRGDVAPLRDVVPDVPQSLEAIVERALLRDPAARFSDALEMQQSLERALCQNQVVIGASDVAHVLSTLSLPRKDPKDQLVPRARSGVSNLASARFAARPSSTGSRQRRSALYVFAAAFGAAAVSLALLGSGIAPPDRVSSSASVVSVVESSQQPQERDSALSTAVLAMNVQSSRTAEAPVESAPVAAHASSAKIPARVRSSSSEPKPALPVPPASAEARPGTLNVIARPVWASIVLDGQPRGSTPLVIPNLSAGSHVLEAAPLGKPPLERRVVIVRSDTVQRVELQLAEPK